MLRDSEHVKAIVLIPARAGSKRIPGKNVRELAGKPLIAYTIEAALESECFAKVLVSSDDVHTLEIAASLGADCVRRPEEFAGDTSPDIEWVRHALDAVREVKCAESSTPSAAEDGASAVGVFSILRPTSPFRTAETIRRAFLEWWNANSDRNKFTSLRAVEPVSQHPGKMWQRRGAELVPLMLQPASQPFHDSQMASLPRVWVQNASLEIAWVSTVTETGTISGDRVLAFETNGDEGFDLNTEYDWQIAERMMEDTRVSGDVCSTAGHHIAA